MRFLTPLFLIVLFLVSCMANENVQWEQIANSTDSSVYYEFIKDYPKSHFVAVAKTRIDSLDWNRALAADNLTEYENYAFKHPKGKNIELATQKLHDAVDREISAETPGSYRVNWPDNPLVAEIYNDRVKNLRATEEMDYASANQANSIEAYRKFLLKWPGTHRQKQIEDMEWEITRSAATIEAYDLFIQYNPLSKYHDEALAQRNKIQDDLDKQKAIEEAKRIRLQTIVEVEQSIIADIKKNGIGGRFVIPNLPGRPPYGNYCVKSISSGGSYMIVPSKSISVVSSGYSYQSAVGASVLDILGDPLSGANEVSLFQLFPSDNIKFSVYNAPLLSDMHKRARLEDGSPVGAQDYNIHRFTGSTDIYSGVTISADSTSDEFISFAFIRDSYVYLRGRGSVTIDGIITQLGD